MSNQNPYREAFIQDSLSRMQDRHKHHMTKPSSASDWWTGAIAGATFAILTMKSADENFDIEHMLGCATMGLIQQSVDWKRIGLPTEIAINEGAQSAVQNHLERLTEGAEKRK